MPNNGEVPDSRSFVSLVYYKNSLYIYGYNSFSSNAQTDIYKYDLEKEYWEIVHANGDSPPQRLGHYAFVHNNEMVIIYGFIEETLQIYNELYKFNFQSKTWKKIKNFNGFFVVGASSVKVGSKVYILSGRTSTEAYNSIQVIDLDDEVPVPIKITQDFLSPSSRSNHCSIIINNFMYMYGGYYFDKEDNKNYFNDFWRFDLENLAWEPLITSGTPPLNRKDYACCKIGAERLAVFGGEYESIHYNELYIFYVPLLTWEKVEVSGSTIGSRAGSCMVNYGNYLIIVGGMNKDYGYNDIWAFDFEFNIFRVIPNVFLVEDLSFCKIWIDDKGKIKIIGGSNFLSTPNWYIYELDAEFDIWNFNINLKIIKDPTCVVKDDSIMIRSGEKLLVMGGQIYDQIMTNPFFVYDLKNDICQPFDSSEDLILSGHSAVHYKKSICIFGGAGYLGNYRSTVKIYNNIYKLSFGSTDIFSLKCSEGTYALDCSLCPIGTYSSLGSCIKCPKGTYNNLLGSTSVDQCIPCRFSTFSNELGSSFCLDCPHSHICPVGSNRPKSYFDLPVNSSIQPTKYKSEESNILNLTSFIWYSFCIIIFIVIILLLLSNNNTSIYLQKIDMFSSSHRKELNKPIVLKKTKLGGAFSILFMIGCCIIIALSLLNFKLDNIIEIRGTVPVVVIEEKANADLLEINFTLYTYGGYCVQDFDCRKEIFHETGGLKFDKVEKKCKLVNGNCIVLIRFYGLVLELKEAEVILRMKETGSYASALSVNISASSSIPEEISSVFTAFTAPFEDMVFKGINPNIFHYKFMPSVITI